ncbi:GNAT family N-acetyltransferase [soil metagenome]
MSAVLSAAAPAVKVVVAHASSDVEAFLARWSAMQSRARSPFQTAAWLRSWYATLGCMPSSTPLCITVTRGDVAGEVGGEPLMLLPLVSTRVGSLKIVTFADADVSDYNSPLMADVSNEDLPKLWPAIRRALAGHDVFRIDKMLPTLDDDRPNPLVTALGTQACEMYGNYMVLCDDWDQWRYSLDKTVRKEFERTWRVFTRDADAHFERVTDMDAALAMYDELQAQQRERMAHAGDRYLLDRPAYSAFYADRLRAGLADGSVVMTALRARGQLVAALYGICADGRYVALRITHAGDAWKASSPGKLLLERTVHHLHSQGLRHIDFAIGDYFHKRVFGVAHQPLVDGCVALSARGLMPMLRWRTRRMLKRQQWIVDLARRLKRR